MNSLDSTDLEAITSTVALMRRLGITELTKGEFRLVLEPLTAEAPSMPDTPAVEDEKININTGLTDSEEELWFASSR